jgi:hypothetical protein
MNLLVLDGDFAVCRLAPDVELPPIPCDTFFSVTRTPDETSLVCGADQIPEGIECEPDWRILKVDGPLDFDLVGILAALTSPLATADISVFAISTFETDYLLVRSRDLERSIETLTDAGHTVIADSVGTLG